MPEIKKRYLSFIEEKEKGLPGSILFILLVILSFVYGAVVKLKDILYTKSLRRAHRPDKKIVSVGNITWGGTGKTPLVISLFGALKGSYKVAVVTKGYAQDEYLLLKQKLNHVFDAKDRVRFLKKPSQFDLFILDDGFQYRKLKRDADIVLINAPTLFRKAYLIPAYIFREPLGALKRADIIVVNYCSDQTKDEAQRIVARYNPRAKIFFARYRLERIRDLKEETVPGDYFENRKVAALTAIGYPQGFFTSLKSWGMDVVRECIYPDHTFISAAELAKLEDGLHRQDLTDVVITYKDFYHIDFSQAELRYSIFDARLDIDNEQAFIEAVKTCITS